MAESVYDKFKNKADRARDAADRRSAEVCEKDKRIAEIDKELSQTGMRIFAAALSGDDERENAYKRLETRIASLRQEKRDRLKALGLPEDYTDVKYECAKCSDTGYVGIKMCDCLKKELTKQSFANSGIGKYFDDQTFDSFSVDMYSFGEERAKMTSLFNQIKKYAETFSGNGSDSLLFMGGTGLGKTHLSSAIAKKVIEKGYSVSYDSAQNIITAFERDRFARDTEDLKSDRYLDADLLIIDDLGAEMHSKSSVSYFYTLINTRLISSKPTIISTNLSFADLSSQYEDRIVSRLFGEYLVLTFTGKDVRMKRKCKT